MGRHKKVIIQEVPVTLEELQKRVNLAYEIYKEARLALVNLEKTQIEVMKEAKKHRTQAFMDWNKTQEDYQKALKESKNG